MVLSLMACALVAHGLARLLTRPLYGSLATLLVAQLSPPATPHPDASAEPKKREPHENRGSN